MTYTRAKLIIWNPEAYTKAQVRAAAVFILGTLNAQQEDIGQASLVL
jgi:hypothetical protein